MSAHVIEADRVFDGDKLLAEHAVVVEGERIAAVVPWPEAPKGSSVERLPPGAWLAPGFVDVQVNGGGDRLFNDAPSLETVAAIAAAHRRFGTTSLLPTFITDAPDKMAQAVAAVRAAMPENPGILGIHLEGPFISPERPGVHDPAAIRTPAEEDFSLLTSLSDGVTLVTLAPERVPQGFVRRLAQAGVRVSLGHSMATYDETRRALAEGLTGFTHLFNAMRPLASRDPGPIAAALETPGCWYGLIADGFHIHPAMLRLALRGAGRPMLVTDAMPPVGGRKDTFTLYGEEIAVKDGRCLRADGTLAGAALDMASAVRNAVALAGASLPEALRMASRNPAEFLGLGDRLGRLKPGYRADLAALVPEDVRVLKTWVAGR
ncbi:MAG TPA: N-acetylglucosamine-6-phosphate deacetylase [Beijerinckiaceae bacterium]|jgi:N-acetylglucosamine-6-phosphate deacetylase